MGLHWQLKLTRPELSQGISELQMKCQPRHWVSQVLTFISFSYFLLYNFLIPSRHQPIRIC